MVSPVLEIISCLSLQKSLHLTFRVLVVSPVLEMIFCFVVQESLLLTFPVLVVFPVQLLKEVLGSYKKKTVTVTQSSGAQSGVVIEGM